MKFCSSSRRSQAALFAEMPAQGSEEGSVMVTLTVLPISNSATLPSGSHWSGGLRKSGAITKPTSGTPRTAAQRPPRASDSFSKKRRRDISSGKGGTAPHFDSLGAISFTANFGDPSGERGDKKSGSDGENDPRGNEAPKEEGGAHGHPGRKIIWPREMLVREQLPAFVRLFRVWFHWIRQVAGRAAGASPNQRAICAKIAPR